jgi:hypothetical protein
MQDNKYVIFKTVTFRRIWWDEHETGMKEITDMSRRLAGRRLGKVNWKAKKEMFGRYDTITLW